MGRIGILGGTFNPIHNGHLLLADNAYKSFALDKVLIMPSGISYLKSSEIIQSKNNRATMVKYAIEDYSYFEFSDIELKREGNTYTYETLLQLKDLYPNDELYFIVGADTLFGIQKWVEPQIIFNNCIIAVMLRDDVSIENINVKIQELKNIYNAKIETIDAPKFDISSSMIRKLFNENQIEYVKQYLPKKVFEYIYNNNLY